MESGSGNGSDESKPCVWCAEEIHPSASLCKNCKKHQRVWIENILMFGSMLGVITFIIGAWSYIAGELRSYLDTRSPPSLRLVDLKSTQYAVVQNTGSRPVYVSLLHYDFNDSVGEAGIVTFNQKIGPGELFSRDLKAMMPVDGALVERKYFYANRKILNDDDVNFIKEGRYSDFKPIIFNEDNSELNLLARQSDRLAGKCSIQYSGAGSSQAMTLEFGCVAVPGFYGENHADAIRAFRAARSGAAP